MADKAWRCVASNTARLLFLLVWAAFLPTSFPATQVIRLGFFPNITHAQALYAKATGAFETNNGIQIHWTAFTAGPAAIESLFADAIDATFVGPNPAITGFLRSHGEKFAIVCGAASGGAALVVREDSGIKTEKDFANKTVATPQLGNTQDVSARRWFRDKGYVLKDRGGAVMLFALSNSDQLSMFKRKQLDAAWTIEPWVSRLEIETGARILFEEKELWPEGKYVTTELVVNRTFLREKRSAVKAIIAAHVALTERMQQNKGAFIDVINAQLKAETTKGLSTIVLQRAFQRVDLTWEPLPDALELAGRHAYEIGFLRKKPELATICDLKLLNEVLAERGGAQPPGSAEPR